MDYVARKIVLVASILRIAGAIAAAGAIAYGIYLLTCNALVMGFAWIVGAAVGAFVGNLLFGLVHLLGSAAAAPSPHIANARRR